MLEKIIKLAGMKEKIQFLVDENRYAEALVVSMDMTNILLNILNGKEDEVENEAN